MLLPLQLHSIQFLPRILRERVIHHLALQRARVRRDGWICPEFRVALSADLMRLEASGLALARDAWLSLRMDLLLDFALAISQIWCAILRDVGDIWTKLGPIVVLLRLRHAFNIGHGARPLVIQLAVLLILHDQSYVQFGASQLVHSRFGVRGIFVWVPLLGRLLIYVRLIVQRQLELSLRIQF